MTTDSKSATETVRTSSMTTSPCALHWTGMFRVAGFAVKTFDSLQQLRARSHAALCCAVLDLRDAGARWSCVARATLKEAGWMFPGPITGHGDAPTSVRAMKMGGARSTSSGEAVRNCRTNGRSPPASTRAGQRARARSVRRRPEAGCSPGGRRRFSSSSRRLLNGGTPAPALCRGRFTAVHRGRVMEKMAAGSLAELVRIAERLTTK